MARTSRKNNHGIHVEQEKTDNGIKRIQTAVYARISFENEQKRESDSIGHQVQYGENYVKEHHELIHYKTYIDDHKSGINFERPAFNQLMLDVKKGVIQCIVVKDLSRFGRNYVETGNYLENILPFLNVRFISINDAIDTSNGAYDLMVPIKNIMNELYAKDLSRKIQSVYREHNKKGNFINGVAPYGYKKAKENKYQLVIDEETAPVVEKIFAWKSLGLGNDKIAKMLNDLLIMSPGKLRYERGLEKSERKVDSLWDRKAIRRMLVNQVYIGSIVAGKMHNDVSKGIKGQIQAESEWIVVENKHEPIVTKEQFEKVKLLMETRSEVFVSNSGKYDEYGEDNLLRGKIRCKECGAAMTGRRKAVKGKIVFSYYCKNHQQGIRDCTCKNIRRSTVYQAVLETIRWHLCIYMDASTVISRMNQREQANKMDKECDNSIRTIRGQLTLNNSRLSSLYESYEEGILSLDEYQTMKQNYLLKDIQIKEALDSQIKQKQLNEESFLNSRTWDSLAEKYLSAAELSQELVDAMIKMVYVDKNKEIMIDFNCRNDIEGTLHLNN